MAILTFTEAAKLSPDVLYKQIIYAAVQEDPLLANMPMEYWAGGQSMTYYQRSTLPTTAWRIETDAMSSTAPVRLPYTVQLKNLYTQMQVPPFNETCTSDQLNQRAENIEDMALSIGNGLASAVATGNAYGVTIGATATTKGIDKVKLGPRYSIAGRGYLSFDDDDGSGNNRIQYKAPGSATYGAWVQCNEDLCETPLYDGDDPTKYIYVDFDVSDSEGGGDWITTTDATGFVIATTKAPDGLDSWCWPTQRAWGTLTTVSADGHGKPTATGDALSLPQLDWLADQVPGPSDDLVYVMPKRTRRSFKALMQSAGGLELIDTFMGEKLHRKVLAYEGKPIWVNDNIPKTQTAGVGATGTGLTCTSVFLVRVNPANGFSLSYHTTGGPSVSVPYNGIETPVPLPFYFRDIGEMEDRPDHILRMDSYVCGKLRNTQALAEVCGIKD